MNKEIKNQYAILLVQEEQLWIFCDKYDWPTTLKKQYQDFRKNVQNFKKLNFEPSITIHGFCDDDDISHYDIDTAIRENFKNSEIQPDSESNTFFCYVTKAHLEEVTNFLNEKYPLLDFKTSNNDDEFITPFENWNAAKKYVQENKLEIEPIVCETVSKEMKKFDKKIEKLEAKIAKVKEEREEYLQL